MKKTLLSLIMFTGIGIYSSQAQITIASGDVVGAGDVVEQARDTMPTVNIGGGGPSQTWNFGAIAQHALDTLFFKNPTPLPGSSNFSGSNVGLEDTSQDSTWTYLTKNGVGLFVDGIYQIQGGVGTAIPFITTIITFPSNMGTSFGGPWNGSLGSFPIGQDVDGPGPQGVIDSLKITRQTILASNIDGWGNVTTPFGTFPSLRQIISEETIDTTWQLEGGVWSIISPITLSVLNGLGAGLSDISFDTTRTARWWTDDPSARFPIVEMDYEANGTVNEVLWQKSSPTVSVDEQIKTISGVSLYPNPAATEITIDVSTTLNNNSLKILDVTGKLISTTSFNTNKITLSVSNLDVGVYFYNIYDVDGNVLHSNKFVVTK